jgi:hypothetical protein
MDKRPPHGPYNPPINCPACWIGWLYGRHCGWGAKHDVDPRSEPKARIRFAPGSEGSRSSKLILGSPSSCGHCERLVQRPYNARMSREDGRRLACEAEEPEGTGMGFAQREAHTDGPRSPCRPPAVGSIRWLCGGVVRSRRMGYTSVWAHG